MGNLTGFLRCEITRKCDGLGTRRKVAFRPENLLGNGRPARPSMRSEEKLLRRIRLCLLFFVAGLILSGVTAIPLTRELSFLYRALHYFGIRSGPFHEWIQQVFAALLDTKARYPFLHYGTDWLAFGHFVAAIAFIGAVRDPVRNIWVIQFGMIACVLVIPFALTFGAWRGIPWWWRLIDCLFGIVGLIPLKLALGMARHFEESTRANQSR